MALSTTNPIAADAVEDKQSELESRFAKAALNKYNVGQYSYPLGIGVDEDKQHYIAFFINVRGKSKFNRRSANGKETGFQTILDNVKVGVGQNRLDPNRTGDQIRAAGVVTGATAGGIGQAASDVFKGEVSLQTLGKAAVSSAAGAAVGAAIATLAKETKLVEPDTLKRLSDAIVLHIQDKPTTSYSVNYQDDKIGALGGMMAGGTSATDMTESMGQIGKDLGQGAITGIVAGVQAAFGGGPAGRLLELGTKQKTNAFREQFFESVDYRTFNFRHTFMAKSSAEAQNIKNIITLFKFHMHPELSGAGLFYLYPSEFEIKYFYRNEENTYFDKISSCVLEDMNVDYGGDIFSTFQDGKPVEVNLTLKFKELELLTKERILEGY